MLGERIEQMANAQAELGEQQAHWNKQRKAWHDELRQLQDELLDRAEKTRLQVVKLEARWEAFENEHRQRQDGHESSVSEQIDQRLAGIRAEREAFEHDRHQHSAERGTIHPGEHVRQIDDRSAEIQSQRAGRDRQHLWSDDPSKDVEPTESGRGAPSLTITSDSAACVVKKSDVLPGGHVTASIQATGVQQAAETIASTARAHGPDEVAPNAANDPAAKEAVKLTTFDDSRSPVNDKPAATESKSHVNQTAAELSRDDDSIEAYMARLVQRVRSDAGGAARPTSTGGQPQRPAAKNSPRSESRVGAAAASPSKSGAIVDLSEMAPRSRPAELTSNMSAMRDLANLSARSAINTHQRKCLAPVIYSKLAVAVLSLITAVVLAWMSDEKRPVTYAAALVAMVVGVRWASEYLMLSGSRMLYSNPSPAGTAAAAPKKPAKE
jgi:hypothetical protein